MTCKNCGNELKQNEKFCTKCGSPVTQETENTVEVKTASGKLSGKKIGIIAAAGVLAVIIIAVLAFVISNASATREFDDALNSGNAYSVNAMYSESYESNSRKEKYDKAIAQFLEEVKEDLNSKDFDADAVTQAEETVTGYVKEQYGTLILSDDTPNISQSVSVGNQELWDEIMMLIESKTEYCSGLYAYKTDNNYQDAISRFSLVNENDSLFENAKTMIGECADAYINSTLQQVDEYINNGDLSGGIDLLETTKSWLDENGVNSEEIQTKINEVLVTYAEKYATNAENAFKEHDVNAAIGNMEVAMELQPDNADYKTTYDTYQQYLPYYLYESDNCLSVEEEGDFWGTLTFDTTYTSNNNIEMPHSIMWYNNSDDNTVSIAANYVLSGKYDVVSGKIFLPDEYKDTNFSGYFKVYGDGKLIYTSPTITKNILPQDVSFSVTGIQRLKINFYGEGTGGFLSSSSEFCVSNLTAQKAFPE